jgi:hypothetical protein
LWAERIKRCTVHGAQTSKGPFKQLKSSLRSRRKLRLVGPENEQKPVRVRSPWRQTARDGRECRFHIPKTGRSREADLRLSFPATAHTIPETTVIASLFWRSPKQAFRSSSLDEPLNIAVWTSANSAKPAASF